MRDFAGLFPESLFVKQAMWEGDRRDWLQMRWIQQQRGYRERYERRYGRGKPIRSCHPLARIGMPLL